MEQSSGIIRKFGVGDGYDSPPMAQSRWPSLSFYSRLVAGPLISLWRVARKGQCDDAAWVNGSRQVADLLENVGCNLRIRGLEILERQKNPCVFIANHMSTLETFVLPAIIRPYMPVTFVVKKSLVTMPVFGHIMRSRNPVVVGRHSPREDLATVLEEGARRLAEGISVVVFPQSTRTLFFDPGHFNTIGIKLARKAKVPVIPIALKTDAWGQGRKVKELGRIRPDLPIRFQFFADMEIKGTGKNEHEQICRLLGDTIETWQKNDGVNQ